jgi:glycosyltransferase involved in cell wall biosynthesis
MKKVAILIPLLRKGGGAEKIAAWLSRALTARGFSVIIIALYERENEEVCSGKRYSLFKTYSRNPIHIYKGAKQIARILKKEGVTNVISFTEEAHMFALLTKVFFHSFWLCLAVRNNPSVRGALSKRFISFFYPRANCVVANSMDMADILRNEFKIHNVSVIYNMCGVAENKRKAALPPPQDFTKFIVDSFSFITSGRLIAQKGHSDLLTAFAQVVEMHPNTTLTILGQGILKDSLMKQAQELSIASKVLFAGMVENPFSYIEQAQCFVFSSHFEGFPNSIIDALSLNKPIISADCKTGPRELLCTCSRDSVLNYPHTCAYGTLIPTQDISALAAAMLQAISDPQKLHTVARPQERLSSLEESAIGDSWEALLP